MPEFRNEAVKAEFQRLVDTGIILPVYERTDCISRMPVAEKKSGIRICRDQDLLTKC